MTTDDISQIRDTMEVIDTLLNAIYRMRDNSILA